MPLWERFDIIKDDSEKEAYLILVVHGIGSNREVQTQNKKMLDESFQTLISQGYSRSDFVFERVMIDWKTVVDQSQQREKLKKCSIGHRAAERDLFNMTAPDIAQYANPVFKRVI